MNVEELFRDYQLYRKRTANFLALKARRGYLRDPKLSDERRRALVRMSEWCATQNLDPRWFLYSLFAARRWVAAPRWDQLVPRSKATERRAVARCQAMSAAPLLSERVDEQIASLRPTYDVNRDLCGTAENRKRVHLSRGDYEGCMAETQTVTYGYHPSSYVCQSCPAREECERRLRGSVGFDIMALRRGELSLDEAKRISGRYHERRR